MKQIGTILKFKKNLAIIMTRDCKIVSIMRQPGMCVGLEILFNKNEIINKKNKLAFSSRIVAGVAAIFIIMLILFNPFNNSGSGVYAYVAIDSNTSIEFELDKNNKILKVNYYNDDTNALLKELDLKNQSVDFAIKEVIKKLNLNESTVLISACLKEQNNTKFIVPVKNEPEEFNKLIDICKSAVEANISENVQSKVVGVSYDYKKLADRNKISIGRSVVYEKAKEQGIDLDIEDIKTKSIGETLEKVKIDDVGVVHDMKKAESKKPAPKPKGKNSPKEKLVSEEKKDPKAKVEPIDKLQEKSSPEPKNKAEEKSVPKPKENLKEKPKDDSEAKPDVEPKETPKKNPKDDSEGKSSVEPKETPKKTPKDDSESKSDVEPKETPKKNPKDDSKGKSGTELNDSTKENSEDITKGKSDTELNNSAKDNPKDIAEGMADTELSNSTEEKSDG